VIPLGGHMSANGKLTKEQLASRLGFSTRQLESLVQREELPPGQRRGRQLFWLEEVAEAWERREFEEQRAWAAAIGNGTRPNCA
jgi:hypothetical protein